ETIHTAVKRELAEEVGVEGEVRGLIVVSSSAAGNFIWLLTLLDWVSGKPAPDMVEVDAARFFSLEEVKQSEEISDFLKRIIERILTDRLPTLPFDAALVAEFDREPDQFAIYLGH
ncbi:MAG: NUDIX domain-containing protein, partial [Candidatus Bipolaricaulia bacterium]